MKTRVASKFEIANSRMTIIDALNLAGASVGDFSVGSIKTYCPFGHLYHHDGGREKALRVYPESNSAHCVDYETEILTARGWLSGNEVRVGDIALTQSNGSSQWEPVLHVHRIEAKPRRMLSMESKTHSSLTTEEHRWLVQGYKGWPRARQDRFTTSQREFEWSDRIPYGWECSTLPSTATYDDAFVELVGWFITEGHIAPSGGVPALVFLYQSEKVNSAYCARIRACLTTLYGKSLPELRYKGVAWREDTKDGKTTFALSVEASRDLLAIAPGRVARPEFVAALTRDQLELFIESAVDGDGARVGNWKQLCQKDPRILDPIQMASMLLGNPVRIWQRASGDYAGQFLRSSGFIPAKAQRTWITTNQPVWCVTTPSGTWTARRAGSVYVTGNCFAGCGFMSPVKLVARTRDISDDEAADAILEETGYVAPDYTSRWEALQQEVVVDHDGLSEALKVACARIEPGWELRQFDDDVAPALSRCLGLLSKVKTPEDATLWLSTTKQFMTNTLRSTK